MIYFDIIKCSPVLYEAPGGPPPAAQLNSAAIQSMRQHSSKVSGAGGGESGAGEGPQEEGEFSVIGGQVPTPWPGQEESAACGEGDNPQKENFCGPRDNGGLSAIVDLEGSNPMRDLTGGLFDSVMHSFQEAMHFGKAAILKFISGTRMTGWLFGSFFRGFLKMFKQFRNHLFVISSMAVAKCMAMFARWIDNWLGMAKKDDADEEAKTSSLKAHTDEEREKSQIGDPKQMHAENEGRKQVDELLTPMNREELNKLRVEQAHEGDSGKYSPPFGRNSGQQGQMPHHYSQRELEKQYEASNPWAPDGEEMRRRRKMALTGRLA